MKNQNDPFCAYGRVVIGPLVKRFLKQGEGIRNSLDPDYIHDMRVASRRLRAALPVFSACFPRKSYRTMRKQVRRITRALGNARDRDVQILFLKDVTGKIGDPSLLPGLEYLLRLLWFERNLLQQPVQDELDRLEKQAIPQEFRILAEEPAPEQEEQAFFRDTSLFSRARTDITRRIEELVLYEPALRDPDARDEHHAMRIAAKRLRYTMEVYSGLMEGDLLSAIKMIRKLQDALGDLHDMDVWIDTLPHFLEKEQEQLEDSLKRSRLLELIEPGIIYLQMECETIRSQRHETALERWDDIRKKEILEGIRGVLRSRTGTGVAAGKKKKKAREKKMSESGMQPP